MSVLIKGMEMPKNCEVCPLNFYECALLEKSSEEIMQYFGGDSRHPGCPLVEVLTPHGRLIDADALKEIEFCGLQADKKIIYQMGWNDAIEAIAKNAPTIIQAEEDE
jgi:hypothetical protein